MTTASDTPDGTMYAATVVDQLVTTDRSGEVQVILTVETTARVTDEQSPADSHAPCPPGEREVWLSFPAADENRLRIGLMHLARFGVAPAELNRLHPDHPGVLTLTGTPVYVKSKVINGLVYWNLVWPRERPKEVPLGTLKAAQGGAARHPEGGDGGPRREARRDPGWRAAARLEGWCRRPAGRRGVAARGRAQPAGPPGPVSDPLSCRSPGPGRLAGRLPVPVQRER